MIDLFRVEKHDEHEGVERFSITWVSDDLMRAASVISGLRLGGPLTEAELRADLTAAGFSEATITLALYTAREAFLRGRSNA